MQAIIVYYYYWVENTTVKNDWVRDINTTNDIIE
jgi:hypothetical protein